MRHLLNVAMIATAGLASMTAFAARSSLYPADWTPQFTDGEGYFLHDFSYAGFQNGESAPPDNSALPVFNVVDVYGADNTGTADATAAIQQGINAAAADGGIVYLPAGIYRLDGFLNVGHSNIILRGASETETFVYFTSVPASSGKGHITFSGAVTRTTEALLAEDGINRSFEIKVNDASGFSVGDDIAVGWVITDDFIAEHGMTGVWVAFNGMWKPFFRREITAIDAGAVPAVITLDVPLRYPAKIRDGASIRREQGYIEGCGVETMALSNAVEKTAAWSQSQTHVLGMNNAKDCHLYKVHSFESPVAEDTTEKHLQSGGIRVGGSKRVTVAECRMEKAQHRGDGGNGYLFEVRYSNEILFRDCIARDGRHNFIQNWDFGATGIVWLRCESSGSTAVTPLGSIEIAVPAYCEYHHSLAMANLVDSCIFGDGWATGNRGNWSSGAGHTATETVLWNTTGTGSARLRSFNYGTGYVIGTENIEIYVVSDIPFSSLHVGTAPVDFTQFIGGGRFLRPQSLYESQRNRRIGLPEPAEGEPPPSDFSLTYTGANPMAAIVGQRVEISVVPQHNIGEVEYQWHRLEDEALQILPDASAQKLVFNTVTTVDSGTYVCIGADEVGETLSPEIMLLVDEGVSASNRWLLSALILAITGSTFVMLLMQKQSARRKNLFGTVH